MNSKQFIKLFAITLYHLHTQWFSTERLISHQRKKLRKILAHAFMHVPFYRDISQQLKINVHEISSISDLKSLPAVTKETIQEDPQRFFSLIGNRKLWFSSKSSGSTGEPVQVYFDPYCWLTSRYALKLRSLYAMGFPVWGKIVVVRIVESQKLQDQWKSLRLPLETFLNKRRYLSTYDTVDNHLKFYRSFRPHAIQAPPFYFRSLVEAIKNDNRGPLNIPIVLCVSELLDQRTRLLIRKYIGAEVFDIYGCSEFKDVAWECRAHNGYHIHADNVIVEIVDGKNPVPFGEKGDILLTSLSNRAMPLIRYKVGDRGSLSKRICSCGRNLPMMKVIEGRSVDFIKLPNGNKISPYGIINLFEEIRDLKHFQIIQRSDFSLDVYLTTSATIVPRKNSLIGEINHTLRNELEDSIDIRCKIVELIEVGKGEKCRFVRSELSMQEM